MFTDDREGSARSSEGNSIMDSEEEKYGLLGSVSLSSWYGCLRTNYFIE
jgi:hypothetical protein